MAGVEGVRSLGAELGRSYPGYVRGRLKFRGKQIVYVAFSLDETVMGFAFPKEEREALVLAEPHKFQLPTVGSALPLGPCPPRGAGPDRSPRARRGRVAHGRPPEGLPRLRPRAPDR